VQLKFHISFPRGLAVNDEHAIVAIVRDSVLLDNITQGKYVGDGLLVDIKEIIKIRSRQHEHTSQCYGPAWLTRERGAVNCHTIHLGVNQPFLPCD
jgi:hypothetical protein